MTTKTIKITGLPQRQHAYIKWELTNGNFSASGLIYHNGKYWSATQNLDEIAELAPNDERVQRIVKVWQEYQLNDFRAGSPRQMEFLKTQTKPENIKTSHYEWACIVLEAAGLLTDNDYIHNGKPYKYGTEWLKTELPQNIVDEITAWDAWIE